MPSLPDLIIDPLTASPLPIGLDLNKLQARVDGSDEDDLLAVYIPSAILAAENFMHRTICARPHKWVLRDFPRTARQEIWLPRGKTQSVESIVYKRGGATVTLTGPSSGSPPGSDWQEDLRGNDGASIMPLRGRTWPSVDDDVPDPVVINFTAGWTESEIPEAIRHAILFAVADAFGVRNQEDYRQDLPRVFARERMLSDWAMARIY